MPPLQVAPHLRADNGSVAEDSLVEKSMQRWVAHRDSLAVVSDSFRREHGSIDLSSPSRTKPALVPTMAPELPEAFDRMGSSVAASLAAVKAALIENKASNSVHRVVLCGPGGSGKTALAAAIVRDPNVLSCFTAAAWVTVGETPCVPALQRQLLVHWGVTKKAKIGDLSELSLDGDASSPSPSARTEQSNFSERSQRAVTERMASHVGSGALRSTIASYKAQLRQATAHRRLLLVLDDVWDADVVNSLCVLDDVHTCACLVTSRFSGLVSGATEVPITEMSTDEAIKLVLASGQLEHLADAPPAAALEAVDVCGRNPLALMVAGSMIEEHADDWIQWLPEALVLEHAAELREYVVPSDVRLCPVPACGLADLREASQRLEGTVMPAMPIDELDETLEDIVIWRSLRYVSMRELPRGAEHFSGPDYVSHFVSASLFLHFAAFAPGAAVPVAAIDAIAPIVLRDEAGILQDSQMIEEMFCPLDAVSGSSGSMAVRASVRQKRRSVTGSRRPESAVRKSLLMLVKASMLHGSMHEGFKMPALGQAFVNSMLARAENGAQKVHACFVDALLRTLAADEGSEKSSMTNLGDQAQSVTAGELLSSSRSTRASREASWSANGPSEGSTLRRKPRRPSSRELEEDKDIVIETCLSDLWLYAEEHLAWHVSHLRMEESDGTAMEPVADEHKSTLVPMRGQAALRTALFANPNPGVRALVGRALGFEQQHVSMLRAMLPHAHLTITPPPSLYSLDARLSKIATPSPHVRGGKSGGGHARNAPPGSCTPAGADEDGNLDQQDDEDRGVKDQDDEEGESSSSSHDLDGDSESSDNNDTKW